MAVNVDYPDILQNFPEYLSAKRSESASFLIWYLEQYYRLESTEAVDSVCDQGGDKGVDGIFINDMNRTITVFQSKLSQRANSTVGDAQLRNFLGTLEQFKSAETIEHLLSTAGDAQVANLIRHSGLIEKISSYDLRGEYIVNIDLDQNGSDFLKQYRNIITFIGKKELVAKFLSNERDLPIQKIVSFDVLGVSYAEHIIDSDTKAVIAPIKARELIALDGIEDQSLFTYNVRGPLERTHVNKDLANSIRDKSTHKHFPLFHNGITVIANHLAVFADRIEIGGYFVVNGCQSITTLFGNKHAITEDLKLLTKFIKMDPTSLQAKQITDYSNNQNSVRARDFKSNDAIQIRLRKEFEQIYKDRYCFEIKRGETSATGEVISNEEAGLYMMAFDLKEPWGTYRKYEVFEDKHGDVFGKPYVTADKIVMLRIIYNVICDHLGSIKEELLAKYMLTRYMLMYILREMLSEDEMFQDIILHPEDWVRDEGTADMFADTISLFIGDIIIDINEESKDFEEDFDYRRKVKNADWVRDLTKTIQKGYQKNVKRGKSATFAAEWGNHARV
ncbi:AIPR family protein [Methylobacterium sp. J-076]|uniref:AIPR family protein n=1 Tax=Methylobacterium sp. J-076 TaxID=2836655 RepID=UPI001FBBD850|nr:AIPR family protein [Methylobacterium sp. J-076]MCJ2013281.1 AIPR family protein [Methylobacterium sp. J-076]